MKDIRVQHFRKGPLLASTKIASICYNKVLDNVSLYLSLLRSFLQTQSEPKTPLRRKSLPPKLGTYEVSYAQAEMF